MSSRPADVAVVGAGVAGAAVAGCLARQGRRVVLIDPRPRYPDCFKAEKIEPDQAEILQKLGLLECLFPHCGRIHEVLEAKGGRVLEALKVEQLGIYYQEMVNLLRGALPPSVDFRLGQVQDIALGPDVQRVVLRDGGEVHARLVVLATGTSNALGARLGLDRRIIQREQSFGFGFDLARTDGGPFPFEALTYYPHGSSTSVAYLTLFTMRHTMRANLFTFWPSNGEKVRTFVREPKAMLLGVLPGLRRLTGDVEIASRVQSARIDLYRVEPRPLPGLVPIADAYQSVCPTTGTGLTKALTDIDVLCSDLVPRWLSTGGMTEEKIASWFDHDRKRAVDDLSLGKARYRRAVSLDASVRWRLHRARVSFAMWRRGGREARRLTRKLTAGGPSRQTTKA